MDRSIPRRRFSMAKGLSITMISPYYVIPNDENIRVYQVEPIDTAVRIGVDSQDTRWISFVRVLGG